MNLPKLETPIFKTNLISNKKEIKFRPMLVKEEKNLLIAMENNDQNIIINNFLEILKNCIITKNIDVEKLPFFDIIHLFIQLRSKSFGEMIKVNVKDTVENKTFPYEINLNEVKIEYNNNNNNNNNIKLSNSMGIILKYPTIFNIIEVQNNLDTINIINLLSNCIEKIYDEEEVYECSNYSNEEIIEFIDNLSPQMLKNISKFFENIPKITYEKNINSPFNKERTILIKIENFIDFLA